MNDARSTLYIKVRKKKHNVKSQFSFDEFHDLSIYLVINTIIHKIHIYTRKHNHKIFIVYISNFVQDLPSTIFAIIKYI